MDVPNLLHVILLLVLALTNYLVVMAKRTLEERIEGLEKVISEFTKDLDDATPKN